MARNLPRFDYSRADDVSASAFRVGALDGALARGAVVRNRHGGCAVVGSARLSTRRLAGAAVSQRFTN
jgi:hypothetical protein